MDGQRPGVLTGPSAVGYRDSDVDVGRRVPGEGRRPAAVQAHGRDEGGHRAAHAEGNAAPVARPVRRRGTRRSTSCIGRRARRQSRERGAPDLSHCAIRLARCSAALIVPVLRLGRSTVRGDRGRALPTEPSAPLIVPECTSVKYALVSRLATATRQALAANTTTKVRSFRCPTVSLIAKRASFPQLVLGGLNGQTAWPEGNDRRRGRRQIERHLRRDGAWQKCLHTSPSPRSRHRRPSLRLSHARLPKAVAGAWRRCRQAPMETNSQQLRSAWISDPDVASGRLSG